MDGESTVPYSGYVSINEAADHLGVKPWEVRRLIEAEQLRTVVLVEKSSLDRYKQETSA